MEDLLMSNTFTSAPQNKISGKTSSRTSATGRRTSSTSTTSKNRTAKQTEQMFPIQTLVKTFLESGMLPKVMGGTKVFASRLQNILVLGEKSKANLTIEIRIVQNLIEILLTALMRHTNNAISLQVQTNVDTSTTSQRTSTTKPL